MHHQRFAAFGIAFGILLLPGFAMPPVEAGLGLESKRPPSDPHQARVDERLIGAWRAVIQDKTYFLHIGKGNIVGQCNWMELALVNQGEKQSFYVHHKVGFASTVGGNSFFSIADTTKRLNQLRNSTTKELTSSVGRYDIFKYAVTPEFLDVWAAKQEVVKAAVNAGAIKGASATIDDTTDNLIRFIESSALKLFLKPVRFVRVK